MLRGAGVDVVAGLPVGMACSDHPELVLPADWPAAPGRPLLEVVLSTGDDIEIRPYTGDSWRWSATERLVIRDWPHIGVALMRPRSRGRIALVSADPRAAADRAPLRQRTRRCRRAAAGCELARELAGATTQVGEPAWSTSQHLCGSAPMGVDGDRPLSSISGAGCAASTVCGWSTGRSCR